MTSFLLALLLFRAYVPVGFMPASGRPFLVELCPDAAPMPAQMRLAMSMDTPLDMAMPAPMSMPAHPHHHSDTHRQFQTCPFGSAPAAGPAAQFVWAPPAPITAGPVVAFEAVRLGQRLEGAHQPRGPPALL